MSAPVVPLWSAWPDSWRAAAAVMLGLGDATEACRMWGKSLTKEEKAEIATVCERFIAETLKPRFLPMIRPTQFNYPVGLFGRWRGAKYSFITRYRSGFDDNRGEEFDSAFTRLDHREERLADKRFDVMWHRHTGQWFRLHAAVTLDEALRLITTDELLRPSI